MKKIKSQFLTTASLCLVVVLMGIFFASVSYSAAVDATKNIGKTNSKWDVNIDELSYEETIGSVQASKHTISATTSTSEVTLSNPGEFYEYSIRIDNDGSLNAILRGINIEGISENQKQYLNYSVAYKDEKYTERTRDLDISLNSKQSANVIVRVEYKELEGLPVVPQTFNIVTTFEYQQA
jgi:hypothetical protein